MLINVNNVVSYKKKYNLAIFSFTKNLEFYWINRVSNAAGRTKSLHSVIHKASINKKVSGSFEILIGYLDIHVQILSAKKYLRRVA